MTVILVRHLKTSYTLERKYCGQIDCSILPSQNIQIPKNISDLLKKNEFTIYSSSLLRCRQTTEIFNEKFSCNNINYCSFLNERKLGILEGISRFDSNVDKKIVKEYWKKSSTKPKEGETLDEVRKRLLIGIQEIVKRNEHIIVIITHQGILREIYRYLGLNCFKKFSPGEVRSIDYE